MRSELTSMSLRCVGGAVDGGEQRVVRLDLSTLSHDAHAHRALVREQRARERGDRARRHVLAVCAAHVARHAAADTSILQRVQHTGGIHKVCEQLLEIRHLLNKK